jgi:alkanesulfonate monooxygenase SsuD/methylene tetrahydromethanopterin reductase-like flavin-dependent oxidoreductase (luciferase family)
VILSAVAASTTRLKLGTAVTPLARRRLQVVVANTLTTLNLFSGGRVVFGAGLGGVEEEFVAFGEPAEAKERAATLDEGLSVLGKLLSGEEVTHYGAHYTVEGVKLAPQAHLSVYRTQLISIRLSLASLAWLADQELEGHHRRHREGDNHRDEVARGLL